MTLLPLLVTTLPASLMLVCGVLAFAFFDCLFRTSAVPVCKTTLRTRGEPPPEEFPAQKPEEPPVEFPSRPQQPTTEPKQPVRPESGPNLGSAFLTALLRAARIGAAVVTLAV